MPPSPTTVILVVLCCLVGALHADQIDEALTEIPDYSDAITALIQNKNAVASIGLQKVAAMDLSKPEKIRVLSRLAEAEVRRKEFGAAIELFEEPGLAHRPGGHLLAGDRPAWREARRRGGEGPRRDHQAARSPPVARGNPHPHLPTAAVRRP